MYDELVLFIKIVKAGSFSEASKQTGISPPNITRKIQKFEKDLNFTVLKRDTHYVELTKAGKELYDKFCDLESEYDKTVSKIEHENKDLSGPIHVLLPPYFALNVITPYLIEFLHEFPKITLNISYKNIQPNLVKDNFDLAIINHRPNKSSQKIKLLCQGNIIFYCTQEYIDQFGLPSTPQELEEQLIIALVMDHEIQEKNTYLINKKTKQKTIFSPAYRIRQNSGYHDKQLAFSGPTIGIGMGIMLKHDIEIGKIIHLLPDYYLAGFDYYLLINPEAKNTRMQVFIDFINECIERLELEKSN
jgi:DNA-binding transcriptional LysR family regulator